MAGLPYPYDILKRRSNEQYVVFRVRGTASSSALDIAYGGKGFGRDCPAAPKLPFSHKEGDPPFSQVLSELAICVEHNGYRPEESKAGSVARARILAAVGEALCEEAYGLFACRD